MSQAHSFITSSWTFYLQANDGKVVVFQSEPQVRIFTHFELYKDTRKEPQKSFPGLTSPIYKGYHCSLIQERDLSGEHSYDDAYNLYSCLPRNPLLPRWILTTTLILSVLVLIWICYATVATAVDKYVPAEKLSINGDSDHIKEQKMTPYPVSSLIIITSKGPEKEPSPLPSKVPRTIRQLKT